MRLTTWNVNGIRNPFSYPPWNTARTFPAMFDVLGSDIVVMQELKIQRKDLRDDMVLIDGWDCYFSLPKHKKGYSGVGIYTRNATCAPVKAEEGVLGVLPSPSGTPYCDLPEDQSIGGYPSALQVAELGVDPAALDAEGRCVVVEFPAFVLLGVYSPANSNGLRDDFRFGFINALDCRIRNLARAGKRVVLVGDLNVSRDERDTASAIEDCRKAGITHAEYISTPNRRIFNQLLIGGEVVGERDEGREASILWDTSRGFHPERTGMYTHWEQKINARPGNYGSRIDFVLVAEKMQTWVKDANIQEGLLGSDHCPVFADFHDIVQLDGNELSLADIMNPPAVFDNGVRMKDWQVQDAPAFSAKKMPEFDKRRSIKSMFAAPSASKSLPPRPALPLNGSSTEFSAPQGNQEEIQPRPEHTNDSAIGSFASQTRQPTPPTKRKIATPAKDKPLKKQKSDSQANGNKGQQSLKGFFQTQSNRNGSGASLKPTGEKSETPQTTEPATPTSAVDESQSSLHTIGTENGERDAVEGPADQRTSPTDVAAAAYSPSQTVDVSPSPSQVYAQVEAAEKNQQSWSTLFKKPPSPLCEGHEEPCKTMQTKKKGSNQGRSFWMCARPLGPSGNKERGTQWRCPTFIWCSDWGGKKDDGKSPT